MNGAVSKATLALLLLLGITAGARVSIWPLVRVRLPQRAEVGSAAVPPAPRFAAESLGGVAITRDPFRIARRPAALAYDPLRAVQAAAPAPPKPTLVLVGIVWDGGSNPTALLEGVPGIDGPRVTRRGEAVGGLRVKRIDREHVVIAGLDTTWTLTVREPWK